MNNEIVLHIETQEIVAQTRKLKAVWTYEAEQDLVSCLSQNILEEIDQEILGAIRGCPTLFQGDFHERYLRQLLGPYIKLPLVWTILDVVQAVAQEISDD